MEHRRVVVGRIGRAHGIHGLVSVDVRTDEPDRRFTAGAVLLTDPDSVGPLTVVEARMHSGRLLLQLDGIEDRTAAESLRGTELLVDVDPDELPTEPEEWYDHQLVGLRAVDAAGTTYGSVTEVVHLPMQDLLAVTDDSGGEVLVPFVAAIVTWVDLAGGRVVLDPPGGLFEGA
ncbi:MAG TPA: ribosome maturation factor RimM [Candidatus Limnocylindria bacterium]|nr:ribosome maturation factor RimM [Candidatus Limnocylindria bacterium]